MTERCYLGMIGYYLQCRECKQVDSNKKCYSTKRDTELHVADFERIFELDNGLLEERLQCQTTLG